MSEPRDPPGQPLVATLVLLRHGEATWNVERRVQGHDDRSVLTARGRDQVRAAAESLAGQVDVIVSSDLARARESAQIVAELLGVGVSLDAGLRERNLGDLEGEPFEAASVTHTGVEGGVVPGGVVTDEDARPPGGESLAEFSARAVAAALRAVSLGESGRVLAVTHGGTIRVLRAHAEGRALTGLAWAPVGNASVWRVQVRAR